MVSNFMNGKKMKDIKMIKLEKVKIKNYKSLKEFADKINIDGVKVKDIWDKIYKLNLAD